VDDGGETSERPETRGTSKRPTTRDQDGRLAIDLAWLADRSRRPTPLLIWLTGASYDLLRLNKSEEKKYRVLGSLVLATGLLAFSASFLGLRGDQGNVTALFLGLVLGLAVIVVDRALVSLPLNPPRIPPNAVASLIEPLSGSPANAEQLDLATGRFGPHPLVALPMNILRLLPRAVVAICLSLIIAEAVLLLRFEDDVNARARDLVGLNADVQLARLDASKAAALGFIDEQIEDLTTGTVDGMSLSDIDDDISELKLVREGLLADADQLGVLAAQQLNPPPGPPSCVSLSDGSQLCISDQTELRNALSDEADYLTLAQIEANPPTVAVQECITMSNGQEECTSGQPGEGDNWQTFLEQADNKNQEAERLAGLNVSAATELTADSSSKVRQAELIFDEITGLESSRQALLDEVDQRRAENAEAIDDLRTRRREAETAWNRRIQDHQDRTDPSKTPPLLARINALELLAQDPDPSTFDIDPDEPGVQEEARKSCDGEGTWCGVRQWFVPPTPLGGQIAAWRYFFLLFDLMPLIAKFVLSSRRIRPYDEMDQIVATYTRLRFLAALDEEANRLGVDFEARALSRRGRRVAAGAEFVDATRQKNQRRWWTRREQPPSDENPFEPRDPGSSPS
jgi:hypothetical protein